MNITIVGHVAIDENISEHSSYTSAGGPAVFIHKICTQMPECTVTTVAPYGKDFLLYKGAMTILPTVANMAQSLVYKNVTSHGMRVQTAHHRNDALPIPIDEGIQEVIEKSDIVFVAPLLPNFSEQYIKDIKASCKKDTLVVLLPQGYYRNFDTDDRVVVREFFEVFDVLTHVDVVIVSNQDHPNIQDHAKKWCHAHKNVMVVVTQGENGAVIHTNTAKYSIPTIPVAAKDIVDSVGAGDTFSAAFAYQYHKTRDIVLAGKFANAVARQKLLYNATEIVIDFQKAMDSVLDME